MKQNDIKKNSLQSVKVVILALALSVGIAMAWTGPTQPPPNGNAEAPINVSSASQEKSGYLSIGKNSQNPLVSLEVWRNSTDGGVIWGGALLLTGNANVGGNVDVGNDLTVGQTATVGSLAQTNNPGVTYPKEICADANGQLVLCGVMTGSTVYTKDKLGVQTFSAGGCTSCTVSTFVPPPNISNLVVKVWGAGGGGGERRMGTNQGYTGLGGGGGEYRTGSLSPNQSYTVIVGERGVAGIYNTASECAPLVASTCDGGDGMPSNIYGGGVSILANGGKGGKTWASLPGAGGSGGSGGSGHVDGSVGAIGTGGTSYLNLSNGGKGGTFTTLSSPGTDALPGGSGRVEFIWN